MSTNNVYANITDLGDKGVSERLPVVEGMTGIVRPKPTTHRLVDGVWVRLGGDEAGELEMVSLAWIRERNKS